jgi:hypothetical protein
MGAFSVSVWSLVRCGVPNALVGNVFCTLLNPADNVCRLNDLCHNPIDGVRNPPDFVCRLVYTLRNPPGSAWHPADSLWMSADNVRHSADNVGRPVYQKLASLVHRLAPGAERLAFELP